ncbi:hypothetical protein SUGI_0080560 [Cryptomeria japonica]|nr:hypothetical protein SUGI_0080560 [Cryptomeria japonica]
MRVDFSVPPLLSRTPTLSVEFYSSHKAVEIGESAGLDHGLNTSEQPSIQRFKGNLFDPSPCLSPQAKVRSSIPPSLTQISATD